MLMEVSQEEALQILEKRNQEQLKRNGELLQSMKIEAMKAQGEIYARLVAGALAKVSKDVSIEKKFDEAVKYADSAYEATMKVILASEQTAKSLAEINKTIK